MPRKTNPSTFTADQVEAINAIIQNTPVEFDTDDIAKDLMDNKTAHTFLADNLSSTVAGNPRLLDNVRQCSEAAATTTAAAVSSALLDKGIEELGQRIDAAIAAAPVAQKSRKARQIAQAVGVPTADRNELARFIMEYAPPANAICPLQLAGDQGCGKTYTVRTLANEYDAFFEVPCFSGMESRDFMGSFLPNDKGQLAWTDMGITPAFRSAASGKSTLLLIDEIYRVADRERNLFLPVLSPVEVNGVDVYRLQIDQPRNGATEVIEAPCHLLSIVATTNIGAAFNVGDDDPAGRERWLTYYVYANAEQIRQVVKLEIATHGITNVPMADLFVDFWQALCELKKTGAVAMTPTVRTLCRAIKMARVDGNMPVTELLNKCCAALKVLAPMWAGTDLDGRVNQAQLELIHDAAHSAFGSGPLNFVTWPEAK